GVESVGGALELRRLDAERLGRRHAVGTLDRAFPGERIEHVADDEAVRDDEHRRLRAGEQRPPASHVAPDRGEAALAVTGARLFRPSRPGPFAVRVDRAALVAPEVDLTELEHDEPGRVR